MEKHSSSGQPKGLFKFHISSNAQQEMLRERA